MANRHRRAEPPKPQQRKRDLALPSPSDQESELEQDLRGEEYHTDSEDDDSNSENEEGGERQSGLSGPQDVDDMSRGYHTDPEDARDSAEPTDYNAPLLPAELLRSRPDETPAQEGLIWDKLTQKEKRAIRDERGISMRELREEALATGALQAGVAAQIRRGVRPANKVAGSRIAKRSRKKSNGVVMSGKQRLLEQRKKALPKSGKGSIQRDRKKKG